MKNILIALLAVIFSASVSVAGNTNPDNGKGSETSQNTIHGKVIDKNTGEALAGVRVMIEGSDVCVYTDLDGNFSLPNIKAGNYNLKVSMISYQEKVIENISLQPSTGEALNISLQ